MATTLTLHITITEGTDPLLQRVIADLLAIATASTSGAEVEIQKKVMKLINLEDVVAFMTVQLPAATPARVRQRARKFYNSLFYWTTRGRFSLRFYCPSCEEQMGICRCDRMGSSHNGQGW